MNAQYTNDTAKDNEEGHMTLADIGYDAAIGALAAEHEKEGLRLGRVLSEHKERYSVLTDSGEFSAEITGNLRFSVQGREDFPAVGDWVMVAPADSDFAVIHTVLPRHSTIKRRSPERRGEIQIIAANIDCALIVQAADRDFNLNRIERYLAICSDSSMDSIIVITKIDLFEEGHIRDLMDRIRSRIGDVPVVALSNETSLGLDSLRKRIVKGKTYCLLGSSGVGKSTLLNCLLGKSVMETGETSMATGKGRHTTSHRELVVIAEGGILIDNPGMREVGITDNEAGMDRAFSGIAGLSESCRFTDCTHVHEAGCAVLDALREGKIDQGLYDNFMKMEKERNYFAATAAEKRKKEKDFGKMAKQYQKDKRLKKF